MIAPLTSRLARLVFLLALTILPSLAPATVVAQGEPPRSHRRKRSTVLTIVGAVVGGAAGWAFSRGSRDTNRGCIGLPCMPFITAAGGALFGYFIGRELDQRYAAQFRGAPSLRPPTLSTDLTGEPLVVAASDSLVGVAGSVGVQVFRARHDGLFQEGIRGRGLRNLEALGIAPSTEWLAIGSPSGLYLFPPATGPGSLVREGNVDATVATRDRVYYTVENRVEAAPLDADTTRSWPGITLDAPARALAMDTARALIWAATDRALVALRPAGDSLERVGALALEAGARRLTVVRNQIAIAFGERGVWLVDASDPVAPRRTAVWTGARFAYDVALDAHRLFVAAGPDGVYVVDISGAVPRTLGLARSLGFASSLIAHDGFTYIIDRRTNSLRRIPSDF